MRNFAIPGRNAHDKLPLNIPWVLIDNTVFPTINRRFNDSEDDDDWDSETLANNSNN
jgi:hypothetical protein